jgi:hypothetical protein
MRFVSGCIDHATQTDIENLNCMISVIVTIISDIIMSPDVPFDLAMQFATIKLAINSFDISAADIADETSLRAKLTKYSGILRDFNNLELFCEIDSFVASIGCQQPINDESSSSSSEHQESPPI